MRKIRQVKAFDRDYRRELKGRYGDTLAGLMHPILDALVVDTPLPARLRDHGLTGNWQGYRDCHVKPDLVLIYRKIDDDRLELHRLGSHSELRL